MEISRTIAFSQAISDLLLNAALGILVAYPLGYAAFKSKDNRPVTVGRKWAAIGYFLTALTITGFRDLSRSEFFYKFYLITVPAGVIFFVIGFLGGAVRNRINEWRFAHNPSKFEGRGDIFHNEQKFYFRLIAVSVVLFAFYYLFSPYQNCVRAYENKAWCLINTSW